MKNILILCLACISLQGMAQINSNKAVTNAADKFVKSLSDELKSEAVFVLSSEERYHWFYTPVPRKGLDFRKLNASQKILARNLLHESLSESGEKTALAIMQLESVLHVLEKRPADSDHRDPEKYYFSIFGNPDPMKPWGWRIEGHHLSLNYSSVDGKIQSATPLFFGTNPAIVPAGMPVAEGTEVLKKETQMGFDFLKSLSPSQKSSAKIAEKAPYDVVSSNNKVAEINQNEGLAYSELTPDQQKALMAIITHYVRRAPAGFSKELLEKTEAAGLANLHFVWMGGEKWGEGHYYRIHNPVLLIEYDCTQNNANHVHSVVRDLTNDWGGDIIGMHIRNDH